MSLTLQQDERGIEGVIILPESGKKRKVRVGTKMASEKRKVSEHETGAQASAEASRLAEKTRPEMNTKERAVSLPLLGSTCFSMWHVYLVDLG